MSIVETIDFTPDRIADGDTKEMIVKLNRMQAKMESWSNGLNNLAIQTIDNTAFPITGGDIIGNVRVIKATPVISLEASGGTNPEMRFSHDNKLVGQMYSVTGGNGERVQLVKLNNTGNGGTQNNSIQIWGNEVRTERVTTDAAPVNALVTKGWVDDTFIRNDGDDLNGNLSIFGILVADNSAGGITTAIRVRNDAISGWSGYEMYSQGTRGGLLYRQNIDPNAAEDLGTLRLRRYNMKNGATTTELVLAAGSASLNCPVSVIDSAHSNTATTRGYVDDTFLPLAGGTMSGGINITRGDADPQLVLNGLNGVNSVIRLQRNNVNEGIVASTTVGTYISRFVSGGDTTVNLRDDHINANKEFRGVATTGASNSLAFATKGYVDSVAGGGGGPITLDGAINTDRIIYFNNTGIANQAAGQIRYLENGDMHTQIYANPTEYVVLRTDTGTALSVTNTKVIVNRPFDVTADVTSTPAINMNNVNSNTGTFSAMNWNHAGVTHSQIIANQDSRITIQRSGGGSFNIWADHLSVGGAANRLALPSTQSTIGVSAVHFTYVNDTFQKKASGYTVVFPTATPSAGQVMEVASVSGSTVTMQWATAGGGGFASYDGTKITWQTLGLAKWNIYNGETGAYISTIVGTPEYTTSVTGSYSIAPIDGNENILQRSTPFSILGGTAGVY